jgi:hypothetical protein
MPSITTVNATIATRYGFIMAAYNGRLPCFF